MPITTSPDDKYAFLFSGSIQPRYLTDLQAVFNTITQYYGYKTENIWVVTGDTTTLTTTEFPGAQHLENIVDEAGLNSKWVDFLNAVKVNNGSFNTTPGPKKTALIYFTGSGDSNGLTIRQTPTVLTVDSDWFKDRLNHPWVVEPPVPSDLKNCYVNIVMQQSHGGQFLNSGTGGVQNSSLTQYSFVSACSSGETLNYDTDGDETNGGFFTHAWTKALQFEKLPANATNQGKYADELNAGSDYLISLQEARDFAYDYYNILAGGNSLTYAPTACTAVGDTFFYLGLPKFLINNGDPKWWESPDIYLTHPGDAYTAQDDIYHTGEINRINIKVANTGTHPVRSFWLGVNHFGSGFGSTAFRYCKNLDIDSGTAELKLSDILKAGAESLHKYDKTFNTGETHAYIVARANLLQINETSLNTSANFNPLGLKAEARRNLDLYDSSVVLNKEVSPYLEEKFALLFSGSTNDQYKTDIEKVFTTLTDYYNFLPGQIWIVLGQNVNLPVCSGANFVPITDKAELETAFNSFTGTVSTLRPELGGTDYINSAVVYVTGKGNANNLEIVGDESVTILEDEGWFSGKLNAITKDNCFLHLIMQQDFSQNFHVNDLDKLTRRGSISYASAYDQANAGNVTNGSYFTEAWCKALQMEALPIGTTNFGDYADQLGGGAESTNLLVSLSEAQLYAQQIIEKHIIDTVITSPINSSQINQNRSNDPNYLGKPAFLIRDGDQQTPAEYKHESPDIYINILGNDLYDVGVNTVYVNIKNNGTHPVRNFWIGTKHFGSGLGPSDAWNIENPSLSTSLPAVLKAGDEFLLDYVLDYDPLGATHRCILARASLAEIVQTSLDLYADWAYTVNDFEAQRNIDPVPVPPPQEPPPAPDEANDPPQDPPPEPEPEPEPDPDPDTEEPDHSGGGAKSVRNIRGLKEHIYHIKNPFKEKRKFLLVFPEFYNKYRELFDIKWFELVDDVKKDLIPLRILDKPNQHISLDIEPGENKKILFYLAMKPKVRFEETIKLPFEILIEKPQTLLHNLRLPVVKRFQPTHVSISGLTVAIKQAAGTIRASVWNADMRPLAGALLFIRTVNGRQAAVLRTGKSGAIIMRNINPDVYKISVETDRWHSEPKFVNLRERDNLKIDFFEKEGLRGKNVKVILDRIKILNDKDPLIFGKGEIKFTSLVMPDQDESRRQIVNLPEKGVYRVSDKPGKNEIDLGVTIFDGYALDNLVIGIAGKEVDWFGSDDKFRRYFRSFIGNPNAWYGKYQPGDEYLDKESVGDWQVWYRIVRF